MLSSPILTLGTESEQRSQKKRLQARGYGRSNRRTDGRGYLRADCGANGHCGADSDPEPTPAFAAIELSGTGDGVPRFEIPADVPAIAEESHTGSANFAIVTLAESGEQNDLLVNTIGNYTGTVLFDEQEGQHSVAFEVTADGPWTITIRPVSDATRLGRHGGADWYRRRRCQGSTP